MGYSSQNAISNMRSTFIYSIVILGASILYCGYLIFQKLLKLSKCEVDQNKSLPQQRSKLTVIGEHVEAVTMRKITLSNFQYSQFIERFIVQQFLTLILAVCLNLKNISNNSEQELKSLIVTIIVAFALSCFFVWHFFLLIKGTCFTKDHTKVIKKQLKFRIQTIIILAKYTISAIILVFIMESPQIQLLLMILIQVASQIASIYLKPFSQSRLHAEMLFESLITLYLVFYFTLVTEWLPQPSSFTSTYNYIIFKEDISIWILASIIILIVAVGFLQIAISFLKAFIRSYQRFRIWRIKYPILLKKEKLLKQKQMQRAKKEMNQSNSSMNDSQTSIKDQSPGKKSKNGVISNLNKKGYMRKVMPVIHENEEEKEGNFDCSAKRNQSSFKNYPVQEINDYSRLPQIKSSDLSVTKYDGLPFSDPTGSLNDTYNSEGRMLIGFSKMNQIGDFSQSITQNRIELDNTRRYQDMKEVMDHFGIMNLEEEGPEPNTMRSEVSPNSTLHFLSPHRRLLNDGAHFLLNDINSSRAALELPQVDDDLIISRGREKNARGRIQEVGNLLEDLPGEQWKKNMSSGTKMQQNQESILTEDEYEQQINDVLVQGSDQEQLEERKHWDDERSQHQSSKYHTISDLDEDSKHEADIENRKIEDVPNQDHQLVHRINSILQESEFIEKHKDDSDFQDLLRKTQKHFQMNQNFVHHDELWSASQKEEDDVEFSFDINKHRRAKESSGQFMLQQNCYKADKGDPAFGYKTAIQFGMKMSQIGLNPDLPEQRLKNSAVPRKRQKIGGRRNVDPITEPFSGKHTIVSIGNQSNKNQLISQQDSDPSILRSSVDEEESVEQQNNSKDSEVEIQNQLQQVFPQ